MASVKIRKSSCGICSSQCPLDIRVQDGKIRSSNMGASAPRELLPGSMYITKNGSCIL